MENRLLEQEADKKPIKDTATDTAPWTIQQTFLGVFLTLLPWIALTLVLTSLSRNASITKPLSPRADLIGAIVTLVFSVIIEGAFLIAPFYFANAAFRSITPYARLALDALGFRRYPVGRTLLWVAVLMVAIFVVNALYSYLISALHLNVQTNDQLLLQQSKVAPLTTYATLLAAVIVAPFCEEVFFRGFVFPGLRRGMPVGWAIVLSSLLFAVSHADPGSFVVLVIIGLALATLRWRTRSIWPAILLHMLNNGIAALTVVLAMQGITY
jgi:membrane protease YdiL (CAAX protease family)